MGLLHGVAPPVAWPNMPAAAGPAACCLQGEGGDHMALRCRIMDFIRDREEEYRFFM